jgi:hypothetical protein
MMIALYGTIWLALFALLLGELGRRRNRQTGVTTRWAIVASAIGVALGTIHTLLALGVVYDWDHARAATVTAERAAVVYGVAWPLSLYVNYLFLAWWLADTIWWWRATSSFLTRSPVIEWAWRLTAFTMVVNGAVIFASPAGRIAGVPLTAALLFVWWHSRRVTSSSSAEGPRRGPA